MSDAVLWWSGVFAWCFFGVIGFAWFVEVISEWLINVVWSRKEFMAFVWERLKAKKKDRQ
jgi:hypothetical protein